ncbi:NBR1-Ig-like domain-containing protein [Nonomuraea sp. NPDC050310]|uniref:NBR1-Ig-like domain-containing protein n=1 Tax=Nonomuraea sp. NPDC050310 TaxID=3154935 RepID=UPI0033D3BE5D
MDDRRARAEAIEHFAAILRELRNAVGNPPFREMSGRSGAISHTTLHEATKGNRLPSWETTVEFVKACGADPALYRERWEAANRAIRVGGAEEVPVRAGASAESSGGGQVAVEAPAVPLAVDTPAVPPTTPSEHPSPPYGPADGPQAGGSRRFRPLVLVAGAGVIGAAALLVAVVDRGGGGSEGGGQPPAAGPSTAALSPAECPVPPTNPPAAAPLHKGDAAQFIQDVTLPDCTRVGAGQTMTKVWQLKNAGSVPWKGYALRRLDAAQQADQCQTIPEVPIADTQPGETVDIRTDITTPRKPGLCYVRFKMVDSTGAVVFPGNRPINFQIIVGE